jgi:hypothetical protein
MSDLELQSQLTATISSHRIPVVFITARDDEATPAGIEGQSGGSSPQAGTPRSFTQRRTHGIATERRTMTSVSVLGAIDGKTPKGA